MTREEQLAAAGEYVIGTLAGADLAAFEAQMADDAELAATVRRLQEHMQALDDTAVAMPAGPDMWSKIEARLGPQDAAPDRSGPAAPVARTKPSARPWMALAASVVVAAGIGFATGSLMQPAAQPVVIAVLIEEGSSDPGAIVEAFADNSVRIVPLEAFVVPEGRILEVWTLPDPATGPVSLGTFTDPQSIRLAGASLPLPQAGQLYEITLEPAPGSPTGRPTGPILAKGLARLPL
jgi:anti-sigma-K factor RskA